MLVQRSFCAYTPLETRTLLSQGEKKGFFADIIAVSEDPEKNVAILSEVDFVMKDGTVYKK